MKKIIGALSLYLASMACLAPVDTAGAGSGCTGLPVPPVMFNPGGKQCSVEECCARKTEGCMNAADCDMDGYQAQEEGAICKQGVAADCSADFYPNYSLPEGQDCGPNARGGGGSTSSSGGGGNTSSSGGGGNLTCAGGYTAAGVCEGAYVVNCVAGEVKVNNCAAQGKVCGISNGAAACMIGGGGGSTSSSGGTTSSSSSGGNNPQVEKLERILWSRMHYSANNAGLERPDALSDHCFTMGAAHGSMCAGNGQGGGTGWMLDTNRIYVLPLSLGGGAQEFTRAGQTFALLKSCFDAVGGIHWYEASTHPDVNSGGRTCDSVGYVKTGNPVPSGDPNATTPVYRCIRSNSFDTDVMYGFNSTDGAAFGYTCALAYHAWATQ